MNRDQGSAVAALVVHVGEHPLIDFDECMSSPCDRVAAFARRTAVQTVAAGLLTTHENPTPVELAFTEHVAHFATTGRYRFEQCNALPCVNYQELPRAAHVVIARQQLGLPVAADRIARVFAGMGAIPDVEVSRAIRTIEAINARRRRSVEPISSLDLADAINELVKRLDQANAQIEQLTTWQRDDRDKIEQVEAGHDQVAESLLPIVNRWREVQADESATFIGGQPLRFASAADIAEAVYSRLRIADTFASDDTAADEEGWSWARAEHHRGVAAVLAAMYATATERELDAAVRDPFEGIKSYPLADWSRSYDPRLFAPEPDAKVKLDVTDVKRAADGITVTGVVPGTLFADLGKMPVGGYSIGVPKSAVGRVKRLMPNGALVEIPGNIAVRWHDGATDELVELGRDGIERRFKDGVWTPAQVDDSATVVGVDELGSVLDEIHVFTAAEDGKTVAEALADGDMVEVPGVLYDAPEGGNRIVPDADGNHYTEVPTTYAGPADELGNDDVDGPTDTDDGVDW